MHLKECVLFFSLCVGVLCMERKMTVSVNPGCTSCSSARPLIHVSAEGEVDTVHHVWDFTSRPSILIAITPLNTSLSIDWKTYSWDGRPGSLNFSSTPLYTFSVIFNRIIEFNDLNNTGIYSNSSKKNDVIFYQTENFNWTLGSTWSDTHTAQAKISGDNFLTKAGEVTSTKQNGHVEIMLSAYGVKDHNKAEPHLLHTTNSTQIDIALDAMTTSFAQSRFAVEMIAISSDSSNASVSLKTHKNIDDENTPGIFTVAEYLTPESEEGHIGGGYLQWRTVAYTSPARTFVNTTTTHESFPYIVEDPTKIINGSSIYSLVGSLVGSMSVHLFTVSFGAHDDAGYYAKSNYLFWSFLAGYGQPAGESFSLLVAVLISVGLNIVALLAVVAYVLIYTRRIRRNKNDLFFSH